MAIRRALVFMALALLFGGCMFFIDGELGTIGCLDEGAFGPPACPADHVCSDGLCTPGKGILGASCDADDDCAPDDFCLDPALFGTARAPYCARECCSSSDCDGDEGQTSHVCWVPEAGGGSFCRPGADLGRGTLGTAKAGDTCTDAAQCRSGLCEGSRCIDTCCSDTNCAMSGAVCWASEAQHASGAGWSCAMPTGAKAYLEPCVSDAECASGLCIPIAETFVCSQPCCDSISCGTFAGPGSAQLGCVHLPRNGSYVRACAEMLPEGADGAVGTPCTHDGDCRGAQCVDSTGRDTAICSDVCCVDADCGEPASFACRPYEMGDTWALRCELR